MSSWDDLRAIALSYPGVTEGTSYGTPALRVGRSFLTRIKEDGESIVVGMGFEERELLLDVAPEIFHVTDHYRGYPAVLVRLGPCDATELRRLLERGWRAKAPKKLIAAYDADAEKA